MKKIDGVDLCDEEIEKEIEELIRTNQSMAPDIEVQEENMVSIANAMTAMRRVRSYLQATSAPLRGFILHVF